MKYKVVLSDEMVQARVDEHSKLQYRTNVIGTQWEAEITGPFDSPYFGYTSFGSDKSRAVADLVRQLGRNGFIGRLVVEGSITGRGPHTDLVDSDPLSD